MNLAAGDFRWLTVVSPEEPDAVQLLLESNAHPAAAAHQRTLFEAGIPPAAFAVGDIAQEYRRLKAAGVVFRPQPAKMGGATTAVFEDNCDNLIQIYQVP